MERKVKTLWKLKLSCRCRKITCQRKSLIWLKPPHFGNVCLKGIGLRKGKSMTSFQDFKDRMTLVWGPYFRLQGKTFCQLPQWESKTFKWCTPELLGQKNILFGGWHTFQDFAYVSSTPRHPSFIDDAHPNIRVALLLPNTTLGSNPWIKKL